MGDDGVFGDGVVPVEPVPAEFGLPWEVCACGRHRLADWAARLDGVELGTRRGSTQTVPNEEQSWRGTKSRMPACRDREGLYLGGTGPPAPRVCVGDVGGGVRIQAPATPVETD